VVTGHGSQDNALFVATRNPGKMREFRALLSFLPARIVFPADLDLLAVQVAESGGTYAENARIKVLAYVQALEREKDGSPVAVLADDSGLEVDALDGAPGIHSARYVAGSDADRRIALLDQLQSVPWEERTARFRCVMAIGVVSGRAGSATPQTYLAEGTCEGYIATIPAGSGGFGYDPIFYLPEFDRTMAELPALIKNRVSHRARAVQSALPVLRRLFVEGERE